MGSFKPPKPKPFTFPSILFLTALLFSTINYLRHIHYHVQDTSKFVKAPEWFEVVKREIGDKNIKIGLVNVDETTDWFKTDATMIKVYFENVAEDLQWSDLFENSSSNCSMIPMPKFEDYQDLDVVVARISCKKCDAVGMRNVFRLQANLVVANLLVRSGRKVKGLNRAVFAVFIGSSCGPMWEIFKCDDLFWRGSNSLVYKPELRRIKQKVRTCQLAPPFAQSGEELLRREGNKLQQYKQRTLPQPREAYVTVLHSSEAYVCGAIALAQSIILSNSTKDLVLLADDHISHKSIQALQAAGWKTKRIQRV